MALNSRIISSADLTSAGFNTLADAWADENGLDVGVIDISAASYTIPNDPNFVFAFTSTDPQTVTIPADLTNWHARNVINLIVKSTGGITIVADDGVTIVGGGGSLTATTQYAVVTLNKIGTNEYLIRGDLD